MSESQTKAGNKENFTIGKCEKFSFSWEPALETLNSRRMRRMSTKPLQFSGINSDFWA